MRLYEKKYANEPLISLRNAPAELKDGTGRNGVLIGGFDVGEDGKWAVVTAAEDNLLKGAAVQAMQNVNLALGLAELTGISISGLSAAGAPGKGASRTAAAGPGRSAGDG